MIKKCCKKPSLPKNEFWFTIIGFIGLKLGLSASGISNISTYITSYIHEKQTFITMYYGLFIGLIYSFGNGIGTLIGGFLEFKLGLLLTTLTGFCLVLQHPLQGIENDVRKISGSGSSDQRAENSGV